MNMLYNHCFEMYKNNIQKTGIDNQADPQAVHDELKKKALSKVCSILFASVSVLYKI